MGFGNLATPYVENPLAGWIINVHWRSPGTGTYLFEGTGDTTEIVRTGIFNRGSGVFPVPLYSLESFYTISYSGGNDGTTDIVVELLQNDGAGGFVVLQSDPHTIFDGYTASGGWSFTSEGGHDGWMINSHIVGAGDPPYFGGEASGSQFVFVSVPPV